MIRVIHNLHAIQELARPNYYPEPKPIKVCLHCKAEHTHNNCFCSASCCKTYKEEKKDV